MDRRRRRGLQPRAVVRVAVKLQGFNLADNRAITSFTPAGNTTQLFQVSDAGAPDTSIYTFQAGRMLEVTLIGKF
jgi:hypothetical protein